METMHWDCRHRFMYIFNCCMLVGQLCLKIVSTCLSGRVMGVSFLGLRADLGHEDDPGFLSLLLNIMSCHLVCICGTLFDTYDPPIETGLRASANSTPLRLFSCFFLMDFGVIVLVRIVMKCLA
jgi:hypothetical protein